MKLLISAAAGAALFLVSTAAMADVSGLYGNTVSAAFPDGSVMKAHFKADGTYDQIAPDGTTGGGTYTVDAKGVCVTQVTPPPPAGAPQPTCVPSLDGKKAGDSWDAPGPKAGTTVKVTVVTGQ